MVLLSVTLLAAGCHVPGTSSSPGQSAGGQQLTVAAVPGIDTAPLIVAAKDGLFRQYGVSVTVKDVPSVAAGYDALKHGTADIAAGDYAAYFYAVSADQEPLKLIADGYDAGVGTMQVLTLPTSGISSPADLAGKAVGTPPAQVAPYRSTFPYNIETLATESILQDDGVNPDDVTWQAMPAAKMINALEDHQVSAIVVTEPYVIQAEQLGAVELLDSCSGVTANLPLTGYFSTAAFASQHSVALHDFQAAMATAQTDSAVRSTVQNVLRGEHMSELDAALVNIGQYPNFLNVGQVQRVADLMYDSGMITNPVSVKGLLLK
jgi:NitT/TauT family transport system substrate-binding protein